MASQAMPLDMLSPEQDEAAGSPIGTLDETERNVKKLANVIVYRSLIISQEVPVGALKTWEYEITHLIKESGANVLSAMAWICLVTCSMSPSKPLSIPRIYVSNRPPY